MPNEEKSLMTDRYGGELGDRNMRGEGSGARVVVVLGVVHCLARGDLRQSLSGAPQLPCDLSRAHLGRVEEEEWRIGGESGERKSVKSKENGGGRKKEEGYDS